MTGWQLSSVPRQFTGWQTTVKTRKPLIVTARIDNQDLEPFDLLRTKHFPPDRNLLKAHLTMFHRLPGEYIRQIEQTLGAVAKRHSPFTAAVSSVRHLGAGVAFTIASPPLQTVRAELKEAFIAWLGSQDMQKWQPHITVQNKVSKVVADSLHRELVEAYEPGSIKIVGLDLWAYLGGPWQLEASVPFSADPVMTRD